MNIEIKQDIKKRIYELADEKYKDFHSRLCPGTTNIVGVRTPVLRNYAKELNRKYSLNELLKEIAEKGAKAVFREQLLANRKAAENRDAQKYGGIYNRQNTNTTPQHSHDEEGEEIGD